MSEQTRGGNIPCGSTPWWQRAVVYQVYPRSFQDTNGDGIGDLEGIIQRLDYLSEILGVQALWLSPIYPSPMADFGYDVSNYLDVDPRFGNLETFDRLVRESHHRNLKLIIDFVPNHSSDQHPWFLESRRGRASARRDWYVWADARPDGSPPNNWLSLFGGPAWQWDEASGQYYLHSFLSQQPDLNWRNPGVKAAMLDVLRFWLDRGVDGFRIDVAHFVMKDPGLRDNPRASTGHQHQHKDLGAYDTQIHLHDQDHPDAHQVYREVRALLDGYGTVDDEQRVSIGEIHIFDRARWAAYYGTGRADAEGRSSARLDELHLPFNFALLAVPFTAKAVRASVDELEASLPPGAWPNYVLGNHDEPRLASRLGAGRARVAAMLLLTLRGTPTLYYGDELGLTDISIPADRIQDPAGRDDPALGRDPCRAPMLWDDSPRAGFARPDVEPWLPLAPDQRQINVQRQLDDSRSMLQLYRRLLAIRNGSTALRSGAYRPLDPPGAAGCFVYERLHRQRRVLVALNFTDAACALERGPLALPPTGRILLSTTLARDGSLEIDPIRLGPYEGIIISPDAADPE